MNQPDIDPVFFIFRGTIKGLLWSAIGTLIALWVIWMIAFISLMFTDPFATNAFTTETFVSKVSTFQIVLSIFGGLLYIIFESIIFSMMIFVFLGAPIILLPCFCASLLLSFCVYQASKSDIVSQRKGTLIGYALGCAAGFAALFLPPPFKPFEGWSYLWLSLSQFPETKIISWAILILIPFAATITGGLYGKKLAKDLAPVGEYFSIDWEALQKEEQQKNLTPDTSTDDTQ